jgi:HlyD family secretion protein
VAIVAVAIMSLRPAAPTIERSTLWLDTVKHGEMIREVRSTSGTLVPEDQRIVSAMTAGRVDRVLVRPGARVDAGTVLIEISNPDVQLQALDAERQVKLAEADLANLRANLESQRLGAVSSAAAAHTELREAERGITIAERLTKEGLTSGMDVDRARDRAEEARAKNDSEQRRLSVFTDALQAQLDLRRSEVDRLRAIARFQEDRVASMTVRAGAAGVVQELALQPGQWVNPGQELARVAGQDHLKAVVHIPETQARDITLGLPAVVDTRNGTVKGTVARIDPASQNGTVTVDIALPAALPRGARPDLSIDATVTIERLPDATYVGRPADGSSETTTTIFRVESDGNTATRVPVKFGRGSANTVEILSGLRPGDRVILSEMSRFENTTRIRLQ